MNYYASGKLLIFGEYLVLKGAKCLAIPLRYGQKLSVEKSNQDNILWESSVNKKTWFSVSFSKNLKVLNMEDVPTSQLLSHLLRFIHSNKPHLFSNGLIFRVDANFPLEWGLGSSATLISLLAQWSEIDPYELLENSLSGSGYDVACATEDKPIVYQMKNRFTNQVELATEITDKILFVYSGKKQNTSIEILRFQDLEINSESIEIMNRIVEKAVSATHIEVLESLMTDSEELLSGILNLPTIQESKFSDYPYKVKSLGAWGGDFFMATFRDEKVARDYFLKNGYTTQFNYREFIKF
jgi:mevalonate kinase